MKNKPNSFKTPDDYFDSLTDKLMSQISIEETTADTKGFKVPEGYFDTLNDSIQQKLKEEEPKVIQLKSYKKYYYSVASIAAVLILFIAITFYNTNTNNSNNAVSFDDLASTDIENYLENTDLELSSYEIAELVPIDELEINDLISQLDNENINTYLDESMDSFDELNLYTNDY
ncbi:hypothetical protein KO500_13140 [Cellulophaga baltica]|uniref:hypothetical protein n=1 Tax=Cellulophaga TaxID=104264 RepID=UPI001C071606|nr:MULTISPECIES: hypothetical protein [Cellulophaga]MBU2997386.1 hypothetical protein [Cellulophaga baltica]MDO6768783.1 hypothetical protein [Cellulophaga sp. 1_MG-2023]